MSPGAAVGSGDQQSILDILNLVPVIGTRTILLN
eukprot:SAG31_NODE_32547_length_354_cov_1.011765_1_plen_33_part_01